MLSAVPGPATERSLAWSSQEQTLTDDERLKRELAEAVVGSGEGWISELSDAELIELVSLGGGQG